LYGSAHMDDEETARILKTIGEGLRADMRTLSDVPPPKAKLRQVLQLVRREQELCGLEPVSYDDLPYHLRRLLEQLHRSQ